MAKKNRNNFRSVHKIADTVELSKVVNYGNTRREVEGDRMAYGVEFEEYLANDVYIENDEQLEQMRADDLIKTVSEPREIRFKSIDEIVKEL